MDLFNHDKKESIMIVIDRTGYLRTLHLYFYDFFFALNVTLSKTPIICSIDLLKKHKDYVYTYLYLYLLAIKFNASHNSMVLYSHFCSVFSIKI